MISIAFLIRYAGCTAMNAIKTPDGQVECDFLNFLDFSDVGLYVTKQENTTVVIKGRCVSAFIAY